MQLPGTTRFGLISSYLLVDVDGKDVFAANELEGAETEGVSHKDA
jgi:hypothetical protein